MHTKQVEKWQLHRIFCIALNIILNFLRVKILTFKKTLKKLNDLIRRVKIYLPKDQISDYVMIIWNILWESRKISNKSFFYVLRK